MLRSTALLLEHGLGLRDEARTLESAVDSALAETPTRDTGGDATTEEFGASVREHLGGTGSARGQVLHSSTVRDRKT
jgi:isocitrate/isopropylmalate dehydrogenase